MHNGYLNAMNQRARELSTILLVLLLMGGCKGAHLYNKANEVLAQKLQADFKEAKLSEITKNERKQLTEILERELQVVRRHTLARRDARLIAIIGGTDSPHSWGFLKKDIDNRLKILGGSNLAEVVSTIDLLKSKEDRLSNFAETYYLLNITSDDPVLSCPSPTFSKAQLKFSEKALEFIYFDYIDACKMFSEDLTKLQSFKGEFGEISRKIAKIEKWRDVLKGELKSKKVIYDDALEAYKKELKELKADGLEEKVNKFINLLNEFDAASDASKRLKDLGFENLKLIGLIEKLEEQKTIINYILQAFIEGGGNAQQKVADDAKPYIKFAASLGLISKKLGKANRYPQLSALILQNERLRIQIEGLQKRVASAEARLSLIIKKRDAMKLEMDSLAEANKFLKKVNDSPLKCMEYELIVDFEEKPACRERIGRILLFYANSWSVGRLAQEEIDYMLIGVRHSAALDDSEIALAQWENLISVPITQLVALHGAGIKPDEVARFFQAIVNAAAGTAIGIGVN